MSTDEELPELAAQVHDLQLAMRQLLALYPDRGRIEMLKKRLGPELNGPVIPR